MDGLSSVIGVSQTVQSQMSLLAVKIAAQSEQQMVALLAQAAQSNPAHLGQNIDTYA
jgi:hypothetical protein